MKQLCLPGFLSLFFPRFFSFYSFSPTLLGFLFPFPLFPSRCRGRRSAKRALMSIARMVAVSTVDALVTIHRRLGFFSPSSHFLFPLLLDLAIPLEYQFPLKGRKSQHFSSTHLISYPPSFPRLVLFWRTSIFHFGAGDNLKILL